MSNSFLVQTVRNIFLIGMASEILKWQDGKHDFLRPWRRHARKVPPVHVADNQQNDGRRKHERSFPPARLYLPLNSHEVRAHLTGRQISLLAILLPLFRPGGRDFPRTL